MSRMSDSKARRPRRQFDEEFKAQAVRLVLEERKSIGTVARDLDLTESALRQWVDRARADQTGGRTGLPRCQNVEIGAPRVRQVVGGRRSWLNLTAADPVGKNLDVLARMTPGSDSWEPDRDEQSGPLVAEDRAFADSEHRGRVASSQKERLEPNQGLVRTMRLRGHRPAHAGRHVDRARQRSNVARRNSRCSVPDERLPGAWQRAVHRLASSEVGVSAVLCS